MCIENKEGSRDKMSWIIEKRFSIYKEATLHFLNNHNIDIGTVSLDDDVKIDVTSIGTSHETDD